MSFKRLLTLSLVVAAGAVLSGTTYGQVLFSEDFDDGMAVNRWTAFPGAGYDPNLAPVPMDTNFDTMPFLPSVDGINDTFTGFAFDYSAVGIPSAPNSTGGSTIGLKLQADLFSNALGGFSASPNGLDLTGDYVVKFDHWANTIGPMPAGGSGSTNISTFGILTSGTASETILQTDGVFFAYTGDGNSSADFRAYSVEDKNSYDGTSGEPHAVYAAGGRNNTSTLYVDLFGTDRTAPQSQIDLFGPSGSGTADQTGTINPGAAGFMWNQHEIKKLGNIVTWTVNGVLLITVDMTEFAEPTAGGNISFGHADINFSSTTDPAGADLIFSLVDNIVVEQVTVIAEDADFNGDGDVDGEDFLIWQRGFGTPDAQLADGDADGDMDVDADDLLIWKDQYPAGLQASIGAVPEPSSLVTLLFSGLMALWGYRPCRARVRA